MDVSEEGNGLNLYGSPRIRTEAGAIADLGREVGFTAEAHAAGRHSLSGQAWLFRFLQHKQLRIRT